MSKRPREEEHQSHCAECRKSGGALLCCDACPRSFHLKCIGLSGMPLDDWFCATCVRLKAKESISPSPPQSAPAVQIRADSPADLTASVSTSLVSLASSAQQSSPGHERALLAVQQCGEALRKELEAELSHVASELAAQPTRLAEAQAAVARLQANGAAMLQRSEDLKRLLHNLERIPPAEGQDKAPPALPAPSAGAARPTLMGNAASAAAAAPPAASSAVSGSFGRALSRPGRARTVAVWHTVCMRHCPPPSCPEQPARLRAVVNVLEELAAAHPSLLALVTSTAEVSAKFVAPLVHAPDYVALLERSLPKSWEPPMRLGAANPYAASNGGGLAWSADGERRSTREVKYTGRPFTAGDPTLIRNRAGGGPLALPPHPSSHGKGEAASTHDLDTFLSAESLAAARHASGAVCEAIDHVMRGTCRNAFVAARPPGHHAGVSGVALHAPSQGFCLLNHVAIGARYALRTHPRLARVAIFDFDVHHGNGTQEIFADDPSVLFVSVHVHDISRDPNRAFFPTTGAATAAEGEAMAHGGAEQANGGSSSDSGSGSGGADSGAEGSGEGVGEGVGEGGECGGCSGGGANIVNAPLPRGSKTEAFKSAVLDCLHRLREWGPELILLSAGFDAHSEDPLGGLDADGLALSDEDFGWITDQVQEVAEAVCGGRVVSVLEGGYSPPVLRRCVAAHVRSLMGVKKA